MFCGSCGKEIKDGKNACPYCGSAIDEIIIPTSRPEEKENEIDNKVKKETETSEKKLTLNSIMPITYNKVMAYIACLFIYMGMRLPAYMLDGRQVSLSLTGKMFLGNNYSKIKLIVAAAILWYFLFQLFNKRKLSVIGCIIDCLPLLVLIFLISAMTLDDPSSSFGLCIGFCFYIVGAVLQFWAVFMKPDVIVD